MEFRVGDRIRVIENKYTYTIFEAWINNYARQYKHNWKRGSLPSEDEKYTIVVKAPHITYGDDIYLIQNIKTKQVYMIDENGIELIKENKKFFKKLPNDYTGTIEVENGYIVEKEILDEKEKEYLLAVIRPFKDKVKCIRKTKIKEEYISIQLKRNDDGITLPYFEKGTMYKGMKLNKEYTLKELGLDE